MGAKNIDDSPGDTICTFSWPYGWLAYTFALSNDIAHEKEELIKESSKEVKKIAGDDKKFEQSGLILAKGNGGSSAFVHPNAESFCKKH